jgi:hypothetical protein
MGAAVMVYGQHQVRNWNLTPILHYTIEEFEQRRREPDSFVNRVLSQPVLPLIEGFAP